jgi:hypothetical protein
MTTFKKAVKITQKWHGYVWLSRCTILRHYNVRSEVFTAVKIQVEIYCAVTRYTVVVGYQRFGDRAAPIFRVKRSDGVTTQKT